MWHCKFCENSNNDSNSVCLRCGAVREHETAPAQTPPLASHAPERVKRGLATAIAALSLLLLGALALAYVAWLRGYLILPERVERLLPRPDLPSLEGEAGGNAAVEIPANLIVAEELAEALTGFSPAQSKRIRAATAKLAKVSQDLDSIQRQEAPQAVDDELRAQQLSILKTASEDIIEAYDAFEDACKGISDETLAEQVAAIREEYRSEMERWITLLGRSYINDSIITRAEYALVSSLQHAVGLRGKLDPASLHAKWIEQVAAREQRLLDAKFEKEYQGLAARMETLSDLRRGFNAAAEQLPRPSSHRGRLTENAAALLVLYDDFASKLEDLWLEWLSYQEQLPMEAERPKRMGEQIKAVTERFFSEHMDCFVQMYRIYANDRDLTHPAYQNLTGLHYDFVNDAWPERRAHYRAVSAEYEGQWDTNFRRKSEKKKPYEEPPPVKLRGPPGYAP